MDPVTHTLVGASLAQAGLKRRTALGTATTLIGANLPDVDMAAYLWGPETAFWFRRGLTHGVLALVALPLLLTLLVVLWDRGVRRRRAPGAPPAVPGQLLLLSALAVATHPLLDSLNVYGMRWLMPFASTWYYGDTLFIVDPWVWALLASGLYLARGREGVGAARWPKLGLGTAAAYAVLMAGSGLAARAAVGRDLAARGVVADRLMIAPQPVTPLSRRVVVDDGEGYWVGRLDWLARPRLSLEALPYDRQPRHAAGQAAGRAPAAARFLSWARFPYYLVEQLPDGYRVHIGDARYTVDPQGSWAATTVSVRPGELGAAAPD